MHAVWYVYLKHTFGVLIDSRGTSLVPPTLHSAEARGLMRSPCPLEVCLACTFELLFGTININERARDVAQW